VVESGLRREKPEELVGRYDDGLGGADFGRGRPRTETCRWRFRGFGENRRDETHESEGGNDPPGLLHDDTSRKGDRDRYWSTVHQLSVSGRVVCRQRAALAVRT
jgi:hypothetical protein